MMARVLRAARLGLELRCPGLGFSGRRWLLAALPTAVLVAGFWLCLTHAWVPNGRRLGVTVPDDAFYYLSPAWHLARGEIPSLDGHSPTNGYHPLWLALIVPIFYAWRGSSDLGTPISWVLTLGAILQLVAGVLLWRVMRRLGFSYGARLVALCYFCGNAFEIANAINGLESALAVAALLALFVVFVRGREEPSDPRLPWIFGLFSGLAILARTDHVLLVGVLLTAMLPPALGVSRGCAGRWLLATASTGAALLLPWAVFSYLTTGTVIQSSGLALALIHGRMPEVWGFGTDPWLRLEQSLGSIRESYAIVERFVNLGSLGLPALLVLTGAAAVFAARGAGGAATRHRRQLALTAPLLVAVLALFLVHNVARLSYREWYTPPLVALVALLIGLVVDWAATAVGAQLAALTAMLLLAWPLYRGYRSWQTVGIWDSPRNDAEIFRPAPQPHIADSDCGVASYGATYGITNLDGIANQRAFEALRERKLLAYIASEGFTRFAVTLQLHDATFMGPRYRESLVSLNALSLRVATTASEKDVRIGPRPSPFQLGALDGRELLGDGWLWPEHEVAAVRSIGHFSELLFFLPSELIGGQAVLKIRAVAVDHTGRQPTAIFLNAERVSAVAVGTDWQSVAIPLAGAQAGRNRLRLEYGAPKAVRAEGPDWYRTPWGNPLCAVEASTLRLRATE